MATIGSAQTFKIQDSVIGDLRAIVAATDDLPDDAPVRAKVTFGGGNGGKLRHMHVTTEGTTPRRASR